MFTTRGWFGGEKKIPLGDAEKTTIAPGWLGVRLRCPNGELMLPARYGAMAEGLASKTGAQTSDTQQGTAAKKRAWALELS